MVTKNDKCKDKHVIIKVKNGGTLYAMECQCIRHSMTCCLPGSTNTQFFNGYLGRNLAGVFFIKGFTLCDKFPIHHGTYPE